MNPLIFYHKDCRDGLTAAWIAKRAMPEAELRAIPAGFSTVVRFAEPRRIFYLDVCPTELQLGALLVDGHQVTVVDHHQTAWPVISNTLDKGAREGDRPFDFLFSLEKSGAGLAWTYFHGSESDHPATEPWIVSYVQDRDLWTWKLPQSREVSAYLGTVDFQDFDHLDRLSEAGFLDDVVKLGSAILAAQRLEIDRTKKLARKVVFGSPAWNWLVPVVNVTTHVSEVVGELAKGELFGVGWYQDQDGRFKYCLRSDENGLDVSEIAKLWGGGGHKHAAGFTAEEKIFR